VDWRVHRQQFHWRDYFMGVAAMSTVVAFGGVDLLLLKPINSSVQPAARRSACVGHWRLFLAIVHAFNSAARTFRSESQTFRRDFSRGRSGCQTLISEVQRSILLFDH
jgi:hypothetical protein